MGLDRVKLPPLKQAVDVLGPIKREVADDLGLNHDVKVVVGHSDFEG